jgi:DNA gyrase/topoisomerase IV subunit A
MSKDTIKVNMNVYDIPIVVEQLKKLEQENKQLKEIIKEATRILNSAKNHYGNDGKNWALERVVNLLGDKDE